MENFNAESHFSDEESDESSPGDRPVRRVAVPATAFHGVVGVGRESAKPPEPSRSPRFEALFASEQHRRQAQLHELCAQLVRERPRTGVTVDHVR